MPLKVSGRCHSIKSLFPSALSIPAVYVGYPKQSLMQWGPQQGVSMATNDGHGGVIELKSIRQSAMFDQVTTHYVAMIMNYG